MKPNKIWEITARGKKESEPSEGQPLVLANTIMTAITKGQQFVDRKYGKGKFTVISAEHDGSTIDVF